MMTTGGISYHQFPAADADSTASDKPEKHFGLSVIMPALNEEKNITSAIVNTLQAFHDMGIYGEVIVVNDGSTDQTESRITAMMNRDPRVRMIRHDRPQGIGHSFWDGVDHAFYDVVIMLPGDNENDPWECFRYFMLLDHVDMVVPFLFNRESRSVFRNALSFLYRFIINTSFLVNFNYTNGTILYRKSILKELKSRNNGFFFQTDILIRSVKKGYLFAEVPYRVGLRKEGISKSVTFPSLLCVMRGYLKLVKDLYFIRSRNEKASYQQNSVTAHRRGQYGRIDS